MFGGRRQLAISEKLCGLWLRTVTPSWDRPLQRIPALVARVSNSLGSVLRRVGSCGALPYAWSSPRASAHTVRACREGAGRPHGQYPPHTDPRIPHRVTQLSCERSLHPCMLLTMRRGPRTRHPEPQARRVRARGACRARPGPLHGPWRLPTITGTPRSPLFCPSALGNFLSPL